MKEVIGDACDAAGGAEALEITTEQVERSAQHQRARNHQAAKETPKRENDKVESKVARRRGAASEPTSRACATSGSPVMMRVRGSTAAIRIEERLEERTCTSREHLDAHWFDGLLRLGLRIRRRRSLTRRTVGDGSCLKRNAGKGNGKAC